MKIHGKSVIFSISLLSLLAVAGCNRSANKSPEQAETELNMKSAELSWGEGQPVLTLKAAAQKRLGLATATLAASVERSEITAIALVLSVQDLVTSRNSYIAAQAQLEKSRGEADVARKEYTRLKTLFEENQNISEKSLQSAQVASKARDTDLAAARQQLALQEAAVRQDWGNVMTKWIVEGSTELQRILNQQQMLVQITLPFGENLELPKTISLEVTSAERTRASRVSPLPKVDPRVQGRSYLYVASSGSGLAPGTNLLAHLAIGSRMTGVIVPSSAVVWSEGKAWVYQQTAQDRFIQRPIATKTPFRNGYFVTVGLHPGDKVVTQGAQALLSEEALPHGAGGGADED